MSIQTEFLVWSREHKSDDISIFNSDATAYMKGDKAWRIVLARRAIFSGKYKWGLKVDYYPKETGIMFGVAKLDINKELRPGFGKDFWGIYLYDGTLVSKEHGYQIFKPFQRVGDTLYIQLEFEDGVGKLSFSNDDQAYILAFDGLEPPLFPAAAMHFRAAQVSILDHKLNALMTNFQS